MSSALKSGLYCCLHSTILCCSYYIAEVKNITFSSDERFSARSVTVLPTAARKPLRNIRIAGFDVRSPMTWVHEEASGGVEYHGLIALCLVIGSPSFEFRFHCCLFFLGFLGFCGKLLGLGLVRLFSMYFAVPRVRVHSLVTISIKEICCCLVGTQFVILVRCSGGICFSVQVYHLHTWRLSVL
jgi:hypothetical protein